MPGNKQDSWREFHLKIAKNTNNLVWDLLSKADRTSSDDQEMLAAAFTSYYHWEQVGTAVNTQRSYWMLSKVYLALKKADEALDWALKCQEITDNSPGEMEDFDLAFASEGLARAYALAGDHERSEIHYHLAVSLGEKIKDSEDQEIFVNDLQRGDWFGFSL